MNVISTWQFSKNSNDKNFRIFYKTKVRIWLWVYWIYQSVVESLKSKCYSPSNAIHTVKVIEAINKSVLLKGKKIYL